MTRRRITLALIGLLVLVLAGWFVQDALTDDAHDGSLSRPGETQTIQLRHD